MAFLVGLLFLGQCIWIIRRMVVDAVRKDVELLSVRNMFLLGFLNFVSASATTSLLLGDYGLMRLDTPGFTGLLMFALSCAFLFLFLRHWRRSRIADRISRYGFRERIVSNIGLIATAWAVVGVGFLCRFPLAVIPFLGIVTSIIAAGMFNAAVGIGAWAWMRQPLNPVFGLNFLGLLLVCSVLLLAGAFGRREVLGLLISVAFAAYWARFRFSDTAGLVVRVAVVSTLAFVPMVLFTATRGEDRRERSGAEYLAAFVSVSPGEFAEAGRDLLSGQMAASNSMWLIEHMGETHPYDFLHSLRYMVEKPIPRKYYPGKTDGLGHTIVSDAGIYGYADSFTIGPGIIGHVWNDFPWVTLLLYPWLLGIYLGTLDRLIQRYPNDACMVAICTAGIGHVIGMPRGDLGNFASNAIFGVIGAFIALQVVSRLFGRSKIRNRKTLEPWKEWRGLPYGKATR